MVYVLEIGSVALLARLHGGSFKDLGVQEMTCRQQLYLLLAFGRLRNFRKRHSMIDADCIR